MKSPFIHLILACGLCAAMLTGYGAWYQHVSAKSAEVTLLQGQVDAKTRAANRLAAAQTTLTEITEDEKLIHEYFVSENGVVSFINGLEARGKSLGAAVDVLSVSTGGTALQPALILTVSVSGPFDAVARAVGSIEYAPYDISISRLMFGQGEGNSWHAELSILVGALSANTIPKTVATSTP